MQPEHPTPESTAPPASTAPHDGDVAATYCATLVDEWARCGLRDAVISPGSRSTPLALAFAEADGVRVHVHHDERSASFMALGLARAGGRPVAVVCTSGTAAAELHAAVVEAHQSFVPLLVLTADRPPELQGVGAPQTIDQRDLYGTAVRWYCEPGPPAAGGAPWWRDLARDAWMRSTGERPGPVQLNLAFREPLLGTVGELPPTREPLPAVPSGARWNLPDERLVGLAGAIAGRKGLLVAGDRAARSHEDAVELHRLAAHLGWPVLADGPSGCRRQVPGTVSTFDPLLGHEPFAEAHRPEVVLRVGGLLASKRLNRWLASSGALQVGVDPYGSCPDPDRVLSDVVHADVAGLAGQLRRSVERPAPPTWRQAWIEADRSARAAIERVVGRHGDATEPGVAMDLAALLSDGGLLVASSSMPVRDLEWYAAPRDGVEVLSNRGANGIDGVVSTAVGAALTGAPTALLIGDVAFLHDTNGLLGLAARHVNLVIVVIDNDGGGIFSFLPQRAELADERFEQLFGTPHGVDLCALAAAHGIAAERVATRTGVQAAIAGALTRGGPRVVVVPTDRAANVALHHELQAAVGAAWDRLDPQR
jgi:2-succinyl-5-enolpyruvyl-6-hydroxy-3-cyclohexene-1-carboxylate synthase